MEGVEVLHTADRIAPSSVHGFLVLAKFPAPANLSRRGSRRQVATTSVNDA